jgi:hypothetical protein
MTVPFSSATFAVSVSLDVSNTTSVSSASFNTRGEDLLPLESSSSSSSEQEINGITAKNRIE